MANSRQFVEKDLGWLLCEPNSMDRSIARRQPRRDTRDARGTMEGLDFTQAMLERTIEGEIIPRLMLAHKFSNVCPSAKQTTNTGPSSDDVAELARLVLTHDIGVASCYIEALRVQGMPLETLLLDLLAPSALLIGEMWKADLCDFVDVTIATSRLQQLLRDVSAAYERGGDGACNPRRALLVAFPGDQHSFGINIVGEFFRHAGWDVVLVTPRANEELLEVVCGEWFDMVGLSVSCEALLERLSSAIRKIRKKSKNRRISVVVGGRYFNEHPESVARVGADATAADARLAVQRLPEMLGVAAKRF